MKNDELRIEVKKLKIYQGISYTEIAEYLEIKKNSLYNWLKEQYDLSEEKQSQLSEIICNLKES